MSTETTESSGVQQLIDRLHEEGVAKGEEEANALVVAARQKAMEILDEAKKSAEEIVSSARTEAERTRAGGEEAIRLACRDAVESMREELREDFMRKLRNLVGHTLRDTEFLKQLILEIGRRAVPAETDGEFKLTLFDDSTSTETPEQANAGEELNQLVLSLGGEALRDGLTFEIAEHDIPGVRVQVVDQDLEIDLTTETLTHLLLKHLSPRFRALMQM